MPYGTWKRYENEVRFTSYFTQVDQVLRFNPSSVLEVGVGNATTTDSLRRQVDRLLTLDIDPTLKPDVVGSVASIPLPDGSVDVALCAEVLEHLPFEQFESCVMELLRVSKQGVVISLPHWGYTFRAVVDIPALPPIRFAWKLPITSTLAPGGEHFWEINRTGYPLARILAVLSRHAEIETHWLSPWNPYHHFFRLRKR